MTLKFRLITYAVVGLTIPLLIWLIWGWSMDALWWIVFIAVLAIGTEIGMYFSKR